MPTLGDFLCQHFGTVNDKTQGFGGFSPDNRAQFPTLDWLPSFLFSAVAPVTVLRDLARHEILTTGTTDLTEKRLSFFHGLKVPAPSVVNCSSPQMANTLTASSRNPP